MSEINFVNILIATVVAFVASGIWYALFGNAMAKLLPKTANQTNMEPQQIAVEAARSAIVAVALTLIFGAMGVQSWVAALIYALMLWLAFPVVLLTGAVVHEKVPVKLAAIHAGDWFVKLILIAVIVTI